MAYVAVSGLLLWAPKLEKRWQRVTSRVVGGVLATPLVIALPAILFGLMLASGNPPTQTRILRSSDGHEAKLSYDAGFLGRDFTEVSLKLPSCCSHTSVFRHQGPSYLDEPKIEWTDNQHLRLIYHVRLSDWQECKHQVGEVIVSCISTPWPTAPTPAENAPTPTQ